MFKFINWLLVIKWLKIGFVIYIFIGIVLYYFQEKIIFQSVALPANYTYQFKAPFRDINAPIDSGINLNIIQFYPDSNVLIKGVILYFHGNKENINHYAKYASNFTTNGYEVWMMDYPGYGKSTGSISEILLYDEALEVYRLALEKFPAYKITIYGKSLGTGIASKLASIKPCKQLILETPYYNFTSLVQHYAFMYPVKTMIHYKFATNFCIPKINVPITIFHGTADRVVPLSNAIQLKPLLKQTDAFITINKGTHNNLYEFAEMRLAINKLLR